MQDEDFIDSGSEQRLERPRSARHNAQRRPASVTQTAESCVSPSFSTTSTIDDSEEDADDDEEFPPVLAGDQVLPPRTAVHYLHTRPTSPPHCGRLLTSTSTAVADQRSRSSSRSPTSTAAAATGCGLCLENLTEARQRVLDRYDRKQSSSVGRRENFDNDARMSTLAAAGVDDSGAVRRHHHRRLEPLTTVNVQTSTTSCSATVQPHHQR